MFPGLSFPSCPWLLRLPEDKCISAHPHALSPFLYSHSWFFLRDITELRKSSISSNNNSQIYFFKSDFSSEVQTLKSSCLPSIFHHFSGTSTPHHQNLINQSQTHTAASVSFFIFSPSITTHSLLTYKPGLLLLLLPRFVPNTQLDSKSFILIPISLSALSLLSPLCLSLSVVLHLYSVVFQQPPNWTLCFSSAPSFQIVFC